MPRLIRQPVVGALALGCVAALCSLGQPAARAQLGTSVSVLLCVGSTDEAGNCGPKPNLRGQVRQGSSSGSAAYRWGDAGARHAGIVKAPRSDIKCPPAPSCKSPVSANEMVRLTVLKNAGYGRHEFDHWERDCASFAASPVCTVRADRNMVVVAVFRRIR